MKSRPHTFFSKFSFHGGQILNHSTFTYTLFEDAKSPKDTTEDKGDKGQKPMQIQGQQKTDDTKTTDTLPLNSDPQITTSTSTPSSSSSSSSSPSSSAKVEGQEKTEGNHVSKEESSSTSTPKAESPSAEEESKKDNNKEKEATHNESTTETKASQQQEPEMKTADFRAFTTPSSRPVSKRRESSDDESELRSTDPFSIRPKR